MEQELRHLRAVLDIESLYTAFVAQYDSKFNFPGESHEVWEIGAVLSGCIGITSGAEVYECRAGEMIIHPPGVFHTAWAKDTQGVEILTVTFTARGGARYVPAGKFVLTQHEMTLVRLLADLISTHLNHERPVNVPLRPSQEQMLKNYLEILCLSLHLRRAETASPDKAGHAALFAEAVSFMQSHLDDALSVEDICTACGIGRTVLKELFRRYTGNGIMQHYNHLRMRRIIERISDGEALGDIAVSMNFSSQSYLTDFFRRHTGVVPSAYFKG
jgi:AraC-like DNA-binding protein